MKTKRKASIIAITLAVSVLMLVGMTVAYLTDMREVTNLLGIGTDEDGKMAVQISLEEPSFANQADDTEYLLSGNKEITYAAAYNLLPGDKIFKDPIIANAGSENIYVRAKVELNLLDASKYNEVMTILTTKLGLEIGSDFVLGTDGYYYYAQADKTLKQLTPDAAALPFFKTQKDSTVTEGMNLYSMTVPTTWDSEDVEKLAGYFKDGKIEIDVVAQAIQAKNITLGMPWGDYNIEDSDITTVKKEYR